ncbi:MAG: hypothetical protein AB2784_22960, partial [Candidatus Thiodiazotropha endolucinida]
MLAFTETWLSPAVDQTDLLLESYCEPERKDRPGDSHGGIMIYIKEGIFYKRRKDLEPRNIECIWLEIANCNRRLLFGLFYRPPSSDAEYLTYIENSIALAYGGWTVHGVFRLFALKFRLFAWRVRLFARRYFVFSSFHLAFFRLFVFSHGVFSSCRLFAWNFFAAKRRNGTI